MKETRDTDEKLLLLVLVILLMILNYENMYEAMATCYLLSKYSRVTFAQRQCATSVLKWLTGEDNK